jgi:hypothetical protein
MPHTPFFPAWRARLAPLGSRTAQHFHTVCAYTLAQLEQRFGSCLPTSLFPKALAHQNSRDKVYTRWRTFWLMLWQSLNPDASGREVVRQLQALFRLQDGPLISQEDAAYCRARKRLPLPEFVSALEATAQAAEAAAPSPGFLRGRQVRVVDGSTVTLPDTPKNRCAYPPSGNSPFTFPMLRLVVFFSLVSGAILHVAYANLHVSELALFGQLLGQLAAGDILIGDRGFGSYVVLALLQDLQVDFIGRTTRRLDGRRRLRRLGKNDWLMLWQRPHKRSAWLSPARWLSLPDHLEVRSVRGACFHKGFRVHPVTVITTLLDPNLYPPQQILQAYLRRWRLEMCLDDLKTTLKMEMLRHRLPHTVAQELYVRLIAHNLVRYTMAQAATGHDVPLERISFKGTLDALRQFTQAMSQARSQKKRRELWAELLRTLSADLVPERPGRREPRAVKRVKNKYPRLRAPRHRFKDRLKRHTRRTTARLRHLGLM